MLHVLVVGFHHKKGCQVEYSYPPLIEDSCTGSDDCPPGWKYLPTLALPDGSHNYTDDTVYFHLPSLKNPNETVFGISCYRQVPVEKIKNRTSDLTRDTVQKAVCVLSTIPLYGHIEVKMSLITHAYFDEGDFTKVSLLKDTYEHLNLCLTELSHSQGTPQFFDGLSARDFVLKFRHKALLLFKLLLLEKRVVFYCSPVKCLCATILSLLSLYPGMLESGLHQSACVRTSRPMSPVPEFYDDVRENNNDNDDIGVDDDDDNIKNYDGGGKTVDSANKNGKCNVPRRAPFTFNNVNVLYTACANSTITATGTTTTTTTTIYEEDEDDYVDEDCFGANVDNDIQTDACSTDKYRYYDTAEIAEDITIQTNLSVMNQLDLPIFNKPLQIFTDGYLCLPYLSLPYMDLLTDANVRGYVIGATNVLFKQKKHLTDVLIEVDTAKIETDSTELKRLLHLSTEDLRFADYIVKHVAEEKHDVFVDDVGWEGGDEWIRMQFKIYLMSLLRTSLLPDNSREVDHFNAAFMSAWKDSNNYKVWAFGNIEDILCINPCHPFAGQLSVADMKLRLSHTLHSSEGGRKLNHAMVTTGKAVGGAISQARGAFSNWWTNLTTNSTNGTSATTFVEGSTH